jgi:TRAP-type C4-dicarboxylate transport system permease small subunit
MRDQYTRAMDRLYLTCIWSAGSAILCMSLIIPWGVFTRYALGTGSQWPEPIAILLMVVFTFIGAAATYRSGGDIAVVMLTQRLPAAPKRVLAVFVDLTMALICLFVIWYGAKLSIGTMGQTISELPWLPVGVTYAPIPIGAAITLLFVIERIAFGAQSEREVVRFGEHTMASSQHEGGN